MMQSLSPNAYQILNHQQIQYKIKRIAYQIYEHNIEEKEVVLIGLIDNGYLLAKKIKEILKQISPLDISLYEIDIKAKKNIPLQAYIDKSIVLIDDVLDTGKTLIYAVKMLLEAPVKRFMTAVLINRNHKIYPVKSDFKGISLSTSLNEHIRVIFDDKGKDAVYLDKRPLQ